MLEPLRILNLEPRGYSPEARRILEELGTVQEGPLTREELLDAVGETQALIVRLGHQIDREVIQRGEQLNVIVSATTGLNHIDVDAAEKRGVAVLSLKGEREFLDTIYATAEHTWALLLALIRHIPQAHHHVLSGRWSRDLFKGGELHGRTLGIVGMGRLGRKVAGYGKAFGMRVLACDRNPAALTGTGVEEVDLDAVFSEADVVSLHVNLEPDTRQLVGRAAFERMKPGALFLNTARGELVEEAALLWALESGTLGGAALDVLSGEYTSWRTSRELIEYARTHDNLLLTPHLGGCTVDSMEKTELFMAEKLKHHLRKESR